VANRIIRRLGAVADYYRYLKVITRTQSYSCILPARCRFAPLQKCDMSGMRLAAVNMGWWCVQKWWGKQMSHNGSCSRHGHVAPVTGWHLYLAAPTSV